MSLENKLDEEQHQITGPIYLHKIYAMSSAISK